MNAPAQVAEELTASVFNDLPLAPFLQETIRSVGYEKPTPIQAQAIPVVLEGRDLIGLAQTGTGKTAAFVLPILEKLSGRKERASRALILAPTRELAEQINDVIKMFSPRTGLKSVTVYGGVSHRNQISQLRNHPQIIVGCPGRLIDHMHGGTIDLSQIEFLVLDEADRMLDMGFLPYIKEIVEALPVERQTLLFSATMPEEIAGLSKNVLRNPTTVRVRSELPIASVTHSIYSVKQTEKSDTLTSWLRSNNDALVVVFTKMKHTAKRLGDRLSKDGITATSLHGNLSQAQRQKALNGFRDARFRVLIATDIASRGIDVEGITHVVNYDMPDTLEAYIHRTGRAGRASRTGDAISFVTREDRMMLRSIESWLKAPVVRLNSDTAQGADSPESSEEPRSSQRSPRGGAGRGRGRSQGDSRRGDRQGRSNSRDGRRQFRSSNDDSAGERPRRERPFTSDRAPRADRPAGARRDDRRGSRAPSMSHDERSERRFDRSFAPREDGASQSDRRERPARQPRAEGRSFGERSPRGERSGRGPRENRGFNSRGERSESRGPRDRGFSRDRKPSAGRDNRGSQGSRAFRGQQDIDQKADYVYRPEGSHFIDRRDPEAKPRGDRFNRGGRGRGPQRGGRR